MRAKKKPRLLASGIIQLDPIDCFSSIAYSIVRSKYGLRTEMQLGDCDRKITWYFGKNNIPKIDKAIAFLEEFRTAYKESLRKTK